MKKYGKRLVAVIVAFVICASLFVVRLVNLQLVNGAAYYKSSSNSVVTKTVVRAARGDILDRNCEPIVQSVSQVSVVINRQKTDDLNATIDALIGFFEKCEDDYTDTFPVAYTNGAFSFTPAYMQSESLRLSFSKYLASKKIETADDPLSVMTELFKAYSLTDRDPERATKIVGVRYEIETGAGGSEYTFAEDVDIKTSTMIEENKSSLPGVTLITSSAREYTMPGIASHILGTVGRISAEEYETLSSKGYLFDDIVGKDGIGDNLVKQANDALEARELIKGRVLENSMLSPREAAEQLAPLTRSEVVQVIGTKFVLYRPSHNKEKKDRIVLVTDKKQR